MFPFNFSFFSSSAAAPTTVTVDFLVIAGGGGGGPDNGGGWGSGAGAGGYRNSFNNETSGGGGSSETALELVKSTNVTVTVGAGGSGSLPNSTSGSNSVFSTITSIGGGHGGEPVNGPAANGGSGGGCATNGGGDNGRGLGTANQGFDGSGNDGGWSGGGGGAGQAGGVIPAANQAQLVLAGGNGLTSSINGTSITRAGGGGGAQGGFPGPGGAGGGGTGGSDTATPPTAGATNTGSGGGGRRTGGDGGDGGSGIVILRYPSSNTITVGAGLTFTTDTSISGVNITTFTAGTGNISIAAATPLAKVNNVYSMAFDAINDFINLGDFTSVLGSTNKFSTSLWCNWQGGTISRNGMLNFAPTFAGGTDTKFDVRFESASSIKITIDNGPTRTFSITPSIGSDWMHIAFTYDGTLSSGSADFDGVKLYINGVDTTGTTAAGSPSALPATIDFATMFGFLGFAQNFNEARKWNGSIDEVGIFNATLTQAQVTSIYNATTTGKTADLSDLTTPPIKWYRMGD